MWSRGGDGAPGADRGVAVPASMSSESAYEAFEGALGSIPPVTKSADAMQVYLFDISRDDLAQVVDALGMASEVEVTGHLHGADAVLALRSRLKAGGWLKRAAKVRLASRAVRQSERGSAMSDAAPSMCACMRVPQQTWQLASGRLRCVS